MGYSISDCRVSLAEYSKPEQSEENISRIGTCVLFIIESEKFYYSTAVESKDAILKNCRKHRIPLPNEIQYVIDGCYVRWNFVKGFSGSEILLWKFIQRTLNEKLASELGRDLTVCEDAMAMLYASDFKNSCYVEFDLSEKTLKVYRDERLYQSAQDFIISLPLSVSEIEEYRNTRTKNSSLVMKYFPPRAYSLESEESMIKYNTERKKAAK